ncbi:MAG TPA: gephyrin-like molybdotransferase Glp [Bacillota bacterium]|nr:gephyrin-like molybdotransferase Glp [Bacillota bacterium]
MIEIRKPIEVAEAVKRVMKHSKIGEVETIDFHDCDNRRLAEPIVAEHNIPTFDKSPYDGFALRSQDTEQASEDNPVELQVIEHIGAGELPTKVLKAGEATRIMTGAKIPEGADCVAMFEVCEALDDEETRISVAERFERGQNIIVEGSEVTEGEVLINEGTYINPGVKALLATFGYAKVKVAKKPVVGVVATGTELLDVDEPLEDGKIRNSNAYMIGAQVERAGGIYRDLGKLADEFDPSYDKVKSALEEVDLLITTGGVSVGDFDLMPAIFEKLGAKILFNKIAMRPGSVTTVATIEDKYIFGLSGNPSACYVGFELFARPVMNKLLFSDKPYLQRITAYLGEDYPKPNPFTRFVRSSITIKNGKPTVTLAGMDKSNAVSSLAHTNCLMVLQGGTGGYVVDSEVDVLLIESYEGQDNF